MHRVLKTLTVLFLLIISIVPVALPVHAAIFAPITLTNNQGSATPNPFQQKVTWNPSTYQGYEASDLGNVRFCADSPCTTQLNAWLESCTPSCTPTATSASAWVKLTSSIAGGGGILTIYFVLQSPSTTFDGIFWGEEPSLSGSYGQYDNGANVFTFYDNFAGTSLSAKWVTVKSSGGSVTVNNGATFTTSSGTDYVFVAAASTVAFPSVAESYMVSAGSKNNPHLWVGTLSFSKSHGGLFNRYEARAKPSCGGEKMKQPRNN